MSLPWPEEARAIGDPAAGGWTPDGFTFRTDVGIERSPGATGPMDFRQRYSAVRRVRWLWDHAGCRTMVDEQVVPTDA